MKEIPIGLCQCGCGGETKTASKTITSRGWVKGQVLSYINGHNQRKHGHARNTHRSPEYDAYINAQQRCANSKFVGWKNYGGRGIKFLFKSFEEFFGTVGVRPSAKHSLDRYPNNDGNYEPGNIGGLQN